MMKERERDSVRERQDELQWKSSKDISFSILKKKHYLYDFWYCTYKFYHAFKLHKTKKDDYLSNFNFK